MHRQEYKKQARLAAAIIGCFVKEKIHAYVAIDKIRVGLNRRPVKQQKSLS